VVRTFPLCTLRVSSPVERDERLSGGRTVLREGTKSRSLTRSRPSPLWSFLPVIWKGRGRSTPSVLRTPPPNPRDLGEAVDLRFFYTFQRTLNFAEQAVHRDGDYSIAGDSPSQRSCAPAPKRGRWDGRSRLRGTNGGLYGLLPRPTRLNIGSPSGA